MLWECEMEKAVTATDSKSSEQEPGAGDGGARLVMLEVGCGMTVPTVRMEMECVLRDLTEEGADASVTLIRINPEFPQNPGWEGQTVSIRAKAEEALRGIDDALRQMSM